MVGVDPAEDKEFGIIDESGLLNTNKTTAPSSGVLNLMAVCPSANWLCVCVCVVKFVVLPQQMCQIVFFFCVCVVFF